MILAIALAAAAAYTVSVILLGRHIRRQRKRYYPALYVVRDERLDVKPALYRRPR